jgi:hypothetical protein
VELEMHEDYCPTPSTFVPPDGVVIEFPDASRPEAGVLARELKNALDNAASDAGLAISAVVARVNPRAQDLGTIVTIALDPHTAAILAGGIALWMRRRNQGRIRIRDAMGHETDISGLESKDAAKIMQALVVSR